MKNGAGASEQIEISLSTLEELKTLLLPLEVKSTSTPRPLPN
ncbi:hypothetical protein HHE06_06780 [Helicobacter heilmannii]|nr:hypothetical protein BN341_16460 [Helicobacter heilmannii ASB1.4]CRF50825.1 hypothetical protein HHE06_06780 [Helicobacter heilmannii]